MKIVDGFHSKIAQGHFENFPAYNTYSAKTLSFLSSSLWFWTECPKPFSQPLLIYLLKRETNVDVAFCRRGLGMNDQKYL